MDMSQFDKNSKYFLPVSQVNIINPTVNISSSFVTRKASSMGEDARRERRCFQLKKRSSPRRRILYPLIHLCDK